MRGACMRYVLVAMTSLALVSGVVADPTPSSTPSGKALVYVIQGETSHFADLTVSVNGRRLENLPKHSYVAFVAEPGTYEISTAGASRAAMMLTVESGNVYYVSQELNADGAPIQQALPASKASPLLGRYRALRAEPITIGAAPVSSTSPPTSSAALPSAQSSAPPARRGRFALSAKTGGYTLSEANQRWLNVSTQVKTKASSVFALSGELELGNSFALEPEVLLFKTTWVQSNGNAGDVSAAVVMMNGKMYLADSDTFRPFVGAGIGAAATSFSGGITGNTSGAAFQLFAGVEMRFDQVSLRLEYKAVSAETEDDNSNVVDISGKGAFAGIGIHF